MRRDLVFGTQRVAWLQGLDLLGELMEVLAQQVELLLLAPDRAVEFVEEILGGHQLGLQHDDALFHGGRS